MSGNSKSKWHGYKLGQISDVRDGTHDTPKKLKQGYPLITSKQIKNGYILDTDYFISEEDFLSVNKRSKVDSNDVLITMIGTVGDTIFVKEEPGFAIKNIGLIKNKNPITGRFIFYWLNSPEGRFEIRKRLRGTSQSFISLGSLRDLDILLPPEGVQELIVNVLINYDNLIENTNKQIKILEEMAQAIYTEWFVNFRFPGHEKVKFVDSKTDFGEMPEDWLVVSLEEICSRIQAGGTPLRSNSVYWNSGEIDWYTTGELQDSFLFQSNEKISNIAIEETSAKLFEPGTILMAIYGSPTVGRLGFVTKTSSCNQAALGLVSNDDLVSKPYLFYVLKSLRQKFNSEAAGAAQQNISKEKVSKTKCLLPNKEVVDSFTKKVSPVLNLIENLSLQNSNLIKTRDLLIPKLVTGEVEIKA